MEEGEELTLTLIVAVGLLDVLLLSLLAYALWGQ